MFFQAVVQVFEFVLELDSCALGAVARVAFVGELFFEFIHASLGFFDLALELGNGTLFVFETSAEVVEFGFFAFEVVFEVVALF